jgi:fatty-acyl-CoA synthase
MSPFQGVYCRGQIAHYKISRYIRFTQNYPMTVTGKIQKFVMRQSSIKELGLEDATKTQTA